jgi:hypothetical protein
MLHFSKSPFPPGLLEDLAVPAHHGEGEKEVLPLLLPQPTGGPTLVNVFVNCPLFLLPAFPLECLPQLSGII